MDYSLLWQVTIALFIIIGLVTYRNRVMNKLNQKLLRTQSDLQAKQHVIDKYIIISTTDLNGTITHANEAFCRISGYSKEELIGKSHNIVRHPDNSKQLFQDLWQTISKDKSWSGEVKNKKKDGQAYWVLNNISPIFKNGKKIGYHSIREDISDKKRIEELSITDTLTGLYNRLKLDQIMLYEESIFRRYKTPFSVIMLDIDRFKNVNDTYGHDVGDIVLKEITKIFIQNIRKTDMIGRWGGEEFLIVCTETKLSGAYALAEKTRLAVQSHHFAQVGNLTISLGVVEFAAGDSLKSIFKKSDELLYRAKQNGRNQTKG